uniref:Ycf1 protein n=1 Tax=Lathraea japonica TaxID=2061027 RepID=UPI00300198DC|nr:Ycf1 protein [Lathraea japonica]
MIFQSFLLGNLVSLCVKIINSVVVVGLYYGFLTTFSIGPSYLFLLRAQVMEEGTEKKVSATTGFITGQLMMFISIYYAPLHLALGRPHTITVLALPYLLFHFFWNNHKHFFDYGSTTRNSMRNFSIQCVFLNNLIFQLFNHFILPSSMLARLVNIYMFRCNNKMLFVTSSFVGWLIGHIFFMKWLGLVLVWIRQNNSIRSNVLIRSNKYLVSELINSMARIFSILLFITCVYYLGRIPSPIFTKKLKETPKTEQRVESEEERDVEIETASEMKGTKQEQEGSTEESYLMNINENHDNSRFKKIEKKMENKDPFFKEKPIVNLLFDSKRWNRPFRYIKNTRFNDNDGNQMVRNEMSQYFFDICKRDGKERICFSSLPSLSFFYGMIKKRLSPPPPTDLIPSPNKLSNHWVYTINQKGKSFNNEFINRIEALDKEFFSLNILERKTRLCNDDYTKEYLSKRHDPFLNRSYRKTIYKNLSPLILIFKKTLIENFKLGINRIHVILLWDTNWQEFEQKKNRVDKKAFSIEIVDFLTLLSKLVQESGSGDLNQNVVSLFSEEKIKKGIQYFKYLLTQIVTDGNDQKIIRKSTRLKEISKKVLRWSYKLITELEQQSGEYQEDVPVDYEIRSRKGKNIVIFSDNNEGADPTRDTNTFDETATDEVSLIHYSQKPDFRRGIIKGSMRSQRRKIVILELFQAKAHSPLFLDRIKKNLILSFDISGLIKRLFRDWLGKREIFKTVTSTEEQTKRDAKKEKNTRRASNRIAIAQAWDRIRLAQVIRGCMLITQSIFRKYILLPSFIITKNIGRILLFQLPEWSEDFQEWDREVHIKCTYNGVPLSETEFPQKWLTDGIQIKILFPFSLKPWNKSKLRSSQKYLMKKQKNNFCFLTVLGMEADLPFGSPRKRLSFFKPIFMELKKKIRKLKKKYFCILIVFKEKTKLLEKLSKEAKKWVMKSVILIKKKLKELSKLNPILLFAIYESRELKEKKITRINNLSSANKTNYNANRFEKRQILKRRNARKICKLLLFFQFFLERIYADVFVSSINIPKKNIELFLELIKKRKKILEKFIYNNSSKQEIINKKKKNPISFISKSLDNDNISNRRTNSHSFYDLSYVSQAYVFYKLSQIHVSNVSNSYKFRSVLHYQETPFFLKPEIKDSFEMREVVHFKLGGKKLRSYEINQWKNWLRRHYQYNLSPKKWSRLIPEKWRNMVHRRHSPKKDILSKWHSYEKDPLLDFKKKFFLKVYPLSNKKENFQKDYRYNLLLYKFLNYKNKTACFFDRSSFQENKSQNSSYTSKDTLLSRLRNLPINNFRVRFDTIYMEKMADRKYFDWKISNVHRKEKVNSGACIMIDTNKNKNPQILTNNSQIITKKDLYYLIIPEKNPPNYHKGFFDWVVMNAKMLKHPISNLESWFFPEFVLLYSVYKKKPWFIPSKLLLLNLSRNENQNSSENKKSNAKEKEPKSRGDLGSILPEHKDIEESYVKSEMKKVKKKYKNKTEAALYFFLKRYLLFQFKRGVILTQRMINNIKVYCLLLRLTDPSKITISSIHTREINLDIMLIQKNLTYTELMKRGVLIIEPIRLSGKKNGQFIIYQTIGISLIHKSKHQTNQKYQEQGYFSKNHFCKAISTYQKITENRDKNRFDLLVPETLLAFRRRKKLRILICFNSKNRNSIDRNVVFSNEKNLKNITQVSLDNKQLDRDKNKLMKLKLFLWPNYRLEDLACMNRYWFHTNNGSRFSMLRVHLYPRLKTCE